MVEQFFLSPKVKRSAIVSNKLVHKIVSELLNNLRNWETSRKSETFMELWPSAQPYSQN